MSWPPIGLKPDWMKADAPNWCSKHNCAKTPMITTSFCPKCENESSLDGSIELPELTIPDLKLVRCYCDLQGWTPNNKFNVTTNYFQCQRCLGYNYELNKLDS